MTNLLQIKLNMADTEIKDGFVKCPCCGSEMCYAQRVNNLETWTCMSCGQTSTTLMKKGTAEEIQVTSKQPRLYRDLSFLDSDGYVWYPATIIVPDKGMVYIDGTSIEDWEWAATPMRALTKKEKRLKQYKGKEYVADSAKTRKFGKNGFLEAAMSLGMFEE